MQLHTSEAKSHICWAKANPKNREIVVDHLQKLRRWLQHRSLTVVIEIRLLCEICPVRAWKWALRAYSITTSIKSMIWWLGHSTQGHGEARDALSSKKLGWHRWVGFVARWFSFGAKYYVNAVCCQQGKREGNTAMKREALAKSFST